MRGGARHVAELADEGADAAAELERAAGLVAVPEGHLAGLAGRGRDEDAVVGDLVDAPGGGAEDEGVAGARSRRPSLRRARRRGWAWLRVAGEEDAVEAAVGDGAAVEDGDRLDALARRDPVAGAVPGDARAELGELVGGIAAGEHVEHAVEDRGAERGEGGGAADEREERVVAEMPGASSSSLRLRACVGLASAAASGGCAMMATICWASTSSGLRRKRVDSTWPSCMARVTAAQATRSARYLGKMMPCGRRADLVAGAADALHAAGDRGRGFDLDDEVDGAHVDAELERRGADERLDACRP